MEPLVAFSLACNILQIVEVTCKTLSVANEYRKAADGATTEQRELRENYRTLTSLSSSLQSTLSSAPAAHQTSQEEIRLSVANEQCLKLSNQCSTFLDTLKIKDRGSFLKSFGMSIKARWYKDHMYALKQALSDARDNLNIAFLLYMHSQQNKASAQLKDKVDDSDSRLEQNILAAMNASAGSLHDEVRKLAEQLKDTYLDSDNRSATSFLSSYHDAFTDIIAQLKAISISQADSQTMEDGDRNRTAQQRVLDSLYFPQIEDRKEQVRPAYASTYHWILQPLSEEWGYWDCFPTWINATENEKRLYWIHGKPGSGKSTIMKFLNNNLDEQQNMSSWADGKKVLKASCFFWAAGTSLQKSLRGLYRTLLFQLMEHDPGIASDVIASRRWRAAFISSDSSSTEWTEPELRNSLSKLVDRLREDAKILILIDGLDEYQGTDEEKDDLADYVLALTQHINVKVCVSSRPLNIFKDAFDHSPQLRLEDLTRKDIEVYASQQLQKNRRWHFFERNSLTTTQTLLNGISTRASGVFLWVHLVVNDIQRGLRDGDSLSQLQQRFNTIPTDLDDYFRSIIQSIPVQHRREASLLLQLALHEEEEGLGHLAPTHSLRLVDISFAEEVDEAFVLRPDYDVDSLDLGNKESVLFRVDSALRRLNSRCRGLLEPISSDRKIPFHMPGSKKPMPTSGSTVASATTSQESPVEGLASVASSLRFLFARVEFLHRSLRDFLLNPNMQSYLFGQTCQMIDARTFLCSARLVQFLALARTGKNDKLAYQLATYLMAALSVNRNDPVSIAMATLLCDPVTALANRMGHDSSKLSRDHLLLGWHYDKGNFLTLAIHYHLVGYVVLHLNRQAINDKMGRPILDHILRPRPRHRTWTTVGNDWPNAAILKAALSNGADPNETYTGKASVWALFLSFLRRICMDTDDSVTATEQAGFTSSSYQSIVRAQKGAYLALETMVNAGANILLSRSDLSTFPNLFDMMWPNLKPIRSTVDYDAGEQYLLSSILDHLRPSFKSDLSPLIKKVKGMEDKKLETMGQQRQDAMATPTNQDDVVSS